MNWINRKDQEPPTDNPIIVWEIPQPIVLSFYLSEWREAIKGMEISFDYWMEAPKEPIDNQSQEPRQYNHYEYR